MFDVLTMLVTFLSGFCAIIPLSVCRLKSKRKEIIVFMSDNVKNVALLYLMNQDLKGKSPDELFALYMKTLDEVKQSEKRYLNPDNEPVFSN